MATAPKDQSTDDTTSVEEIQQETPGASTEYLPEGELVVPADVAPSGHGGTGPAPLPHPLTEEANLPERAGEVSDEDRDGRTDDDAGNQAG